MPTDWEQKIQELYDSISTKLNRNNVKKFVTEDHDNMGLNKDRRNYDQFVELWRETIIPRNRKCFQKLKDGESELIDNFTNLPIGDAEPIVKAKFSFLAISEAQMERSSLNPEQIFTLLEMQMQGWQAVQPAHEMSEEEVERQKALPAPEPNTSFGGFKKGFWNTKPKTPTDEAISCPACVKTGANNIEHTCEENNQTQEDPDDWMTHDWSTCKCANIKCIAMQQMEGVD